MVGSQETLPFRRALQIAVRGIRIRLGRSLVTVSGVVLGIAFLMSNITAQLIRTTVAQERELRQTVGLMEALIQSEIGTLPGKRLAVVVVGERRPEEQALLDRLAVAGAEAIRAVGASGPGLTAATLADVAADAGLLLMLGDGPTVPVALDPLTEGMRQRVVLDALGERTFAGEAAVLARRELFFSTQTAEQIEQFQAEAAQSSFRIIWIVAISLLVTVIGVSNALLMSVTERFREIGTMKCLGGLSSFIRMLFLIESSLIGAAGSVVGAILGTVLSLLAYGFTYSFGAVLSSMSYPLLLLSMLAAIVVGTVLAVLAAVYPATFASRMVPASALRSTV